MDRMDALSEILRVIKLDSAIFFNADLSAPWCLASPAATELAPMLTDASGHVIVYHMLTSGQAYAELVGGERVTLVPGDIVTFPHGDPHRLGNGPAVRPFDVDPVMFPHLSGRLDLLQLGGGGECSRFICGFLVCDADLCRTFLGGLPRLLKINIREDPAGAWLENSLLFSVTQAARREAGTPAMLAKLSEAVFAETVRHYVRSLSADETGWLAGSRDPAVGKALTLLHHRHADPWTVADLAREVGLSRTVLSERFRHFLGETPMAYLTKWRLRLGRRALASSADSVAEIAFGVGYESEASFNRAFKREFGTPPARYRKSQAPTTRAI